MSMAANAQTSDNTLPERLYIVGTMNNWMVPSENPDCDAYSLTDDDADGIYEGSFEIPAGNCQFKVFDAKSDWGSPKHYFGTQEPLLPMFDGVEWRLNLNTSYFKNIGISNWAGGTLTLHARIDDSWVSRKIILVGSGSNQPDPAPRPGIVYINGTFNDWKLPEGDNNNGALALESTSYGLYSKTVKFPEGTNSFAVNYRDLETNEWVKLSAFKGEAPFTLHSFKGFGNYACSEIPITNSAFSNCSEATLRDWNGTDITFMCNMKDSVNWSIRLTSQTADSIDHPNMRWLQLSKDGVNWTEGAEVTTLLTPEFEGKEFLMKYIAHENDDMISYGIMAGYNDMFPYEYNGGLFNGENTVSYIVPVEKDGNAIEIKSQEHLTLVYTYLHLDSQTAIFKFEKTYRYPNNLYLIGSINGWNIDDASLELQNLGDGLFYGEFPVSTPNDVMFRFYTQLGAWGDNGDRSIYGANPDDGANVAISIPYSGTMTYGKGNWYVTNFTGEKLRVTVNVPKMSLTADSDSGIRYIGSADSKSIEGIYDLNGLRHSTLQPGINLIRYTDGSVSKVAR